MIAFKLLQFPFARTHVRYAYSFMVHLSSQSNLVLTRSVLPDRPTMLQGLNKWGSRAR